jgi:hypothetical protein
MSNGEQNLPVRGKYFTFSIFRTGLYCSSPRRIAMPHSAAQAHASHYIDSIKADLSAWTSTIFDFGETAWREYQSVDWYVKTLRSHGFSVEEGSAGMPTAFAAQWTNGAGPSIGMYAEYDAVPGNSQAASTRKEGRGGLSVHAGGHTDPHSGLGISGLGGLLATKAAMEHCGIKGTCASPANLPRRCAAPSPFMRPRAIMTGWTPCCPSIRSTCCRCAIPFAGTRIAARRTQ